MAYLGGAWAVIHLLDVLASTWAVPAVIQQLAFLFVGLGIMPTLVVALYHGEKGRPRPRSLPHSPPTRAAPPSSSAE